MLATELLQDFRPPCGTTRDKERDFVSQCTRVSQGLVPQAWQGLAQHPKATWDRVSPPPCSSPPAAVRAAWPNTVQVQPRYSHPGRVPRAEPGSPPFLGYGSAAARKRCPAASEHSDSSAAAGEREEKESGGIPVTAPSPCPRRHSPGWGRWPGRRGRSWGSRGCRAAP